MTERIEFVLPYPPTVNLRDVAQHIFCIKSRERYRRDGAYCSQQQLKLNLPEGRQ
ncbi:Holliday junction resolvase [Escherichia coli]|nr:Holliday junction resolvase [Escherichia coli]